ncbi:MAG: hypothetical protein R3E93_02560 [Thiothrix sp.]
MMKSIVPLTMVFLLSACTMLSSPRELLNPPKIHVASKKGDVPENIEKLPVKSYYIALELASRQETPSNINDYLRKGFVLVDSYCMRWFVDLDESQKSLSYVKDNNNLLKELGGGLINVAGANSDITSVYDSFSIASSAYLTGYEKMAQIAPDINKVKEQVFDVLKAKKEAILNESAQMDFLEAYSALEKYSYSCTVAGAKEVTEKALENTDGAADKDGKTLAVPNTRGDADKEESDVMEREATERKMQDDIMR